MSSRIRCIIWLLLGLSIVGVVEGQFWSPYHKVGTVDNDYVFDDTETPSTLTDIYEPVLGVVTGLTYQWEKSDRPLDGFVAIAGATGED